MSTLGTQPYGPQTAAVRSFLVRLAGLGAADRDAVVARHAALADSPRYQRADATLGDVITRSGREAARDALTGPLLQLVKHHADPADAPQGDSDDITLDPIAEPALAALLALLVRDLLDDDTVRLLTEAFSDTIPLG
ncbi:MAG: hypothetical protein P3B76_12295 [Gemmatimonadota bacterium]|nr:hypothetical protein [Gemmatimonadota bacterium]MDQ8168242.1 hypothetical protein [Gemmatimonadota bacterium]MDQ8173455.1 hypothetical protein [Gemmatimonadota bacterium]